ncbi:hypothetical protein QJS10_CPA16g00551 [Acorus calamus]|uniref:IBH1-like N-terminal domain-containing protein n=1 Tax=Acorus calamus TaxID=4465 RepID=A0AAV9D3R2_ACOCL|nr:hypothetical protein QJS10_CPA16g00551 [Acorus calamus]
MTTDNPNFNKPIFANRFLRALSRIRRNQPNNNSNPSSLRRRSKKIKIAAYASMASAAAGSNKAWSRALIRRLRNRRLPRSSLHHRVVVRETEPVGRVDELRQLVPGGRGMDFDTLLDETAHYVQCLSAQVALMQSIADSIIMD